MDLPTYTNIWRIEKRLYKLYDLRLPMPLPLVQIGVFLGVFVPWIVMLRLLGVPFGGGWILPLYLVPPAVLTWLATRPVIEGKRLTELLLSQARYVTEPRTWCRLTPIREPAEVVVVARVWRKDGGTARVAAPERAAIRSRRKARKAAKAAKAGKAARGRSVVPRPAFDPAPLPRPPAPAIPPPRVPAASATTAPAVPASPAAEPQRIPPQRTPPPRTPPSPPSPPLRVRVRAQEAAPITPAAAVTPPVPPRDPLTDPSEPPPAVPELDIRPRLAGPTGPDRPPGSGKRGLVSGVLRAGGDAWQTISKTDAEHLAGMAPADEPAASPSLELGGSATAEQRAGEAPAEKPAENLPPELALPGSPASAHAETPPSVAAEVPEPEVEVAPPEPRTPEPEAEATTAGASTAESSNVPPMSPSRPWSEELSRPREGRTDALVWPPPPHRRPGFVPAKPAAGLPALGRQSRPQGTPVKPPPPRVVPEAHELPAPPRETRSGPASPVRPEPRHRAPRPVPEAPAITPPDPAQDAALAGGGLRRLVKAVGGGHTEIDAEYEERLQRPFYGARHIVVLGCTGGAGQTVTALMMGHTFAQHCGEPIVAIDVNPGPGALARRTRSQTPETLTGLITRADQVTSLTAVRRYTSRAKSGLDVIAAGKNPVQALDDRDYALAFRTLDHFYSVTMLDAAAAIVARVLPYADQIVLVAPASSDAARAVQMTFEWLDGHGYDELRARAVTVVNGVSRRSMGDVTHAESVARGRCRALVRIPWDDHLSLDRSPRNELKSLRTPTRRAYLALAGVVAGGFTVVPDRYQEQEASR